jgi:hypothetical protein
LSSTKFYRGFAAVCLLTSSALIVTVPAVASSNPCVGSSPGCFHTIPQALAATPSGKTIEIGPGTYRGGFTISKNVHLVGAGRSRTVIKGGGPVITIGSGTTNSSLKVWISQLSVTGGRTTGDGFRSQGGGINIVAAPGGAVGATVQLTDVTVRDNVATATTTSPSPSGVKCPQGDCPFALARGGGISNEGRLSLTRTTVSGNALVGKLSDAIGAGIFSDLGSLKLTTSKVLSNRAAPTSIGRFAEGAGVFVNGGTVDIDHSAVNGNRADLVTSWPVQAQGEDIAMNANSGGVHIGDGIEATITHSDISHNSLRAINPVGEAIAFDSAMLVGDSRVRILDTKFEHNSGFTRNATTADVGPSGTAVEFDGPADVTDSTIVDNSAVQASTHGPASVTAGLAVYDFFGNPRQVTLLHVQIEGNTASATSQHDAAEVVGAGIFNNSLLRLKHVTVRGNHGSAHGTTATAQGGGIWNGVYLSGPPVELTMEDSAITGNALTTSTGGTRQGAGLYTTEPVTRQHTVIAGNNPDNCFGC